jgi:hypothetical protein
MYGVQAPYRGKRGQAMRARALIVLMLLGLASMTTGRSLVASTDGGWRAVADGVGGPPPRPWV